jgi:hypothetical protein
MIVALAIGAGCACILGSYHLGYSAGLKEAAHMTEECMNMALDCIKEGQDALTSKLE